MLIAAMTRERAPRIAKWSGQEPLFVLRVLLGIVGCVIGLKVTHQRIRSGTVGWRSDP